MHYYRLSIERMEAMAKLHAYYVTNVTTELNYVRSNITERELHQMINQSLDDGDDEIREDKELNENENDEEDLEEDEKEIPDHNNEIIIENYFDLNDQEFQKALEVDVRVVIEEPNQFDHGSSDFDINALINANLNE